MSGGTRPALPCLPSSQLCHWSFQPRPSLPLPVDGQLALSSWGNLPRSMVSPAVASRPPGHPVLLPQELATTAQFLCQVEKGSCPLLLPTACPATVHVQFHWRDVCQKPSLPVLCLVLPFSPLPSLDHPILSEDQASRTGCDWVVLEHVSIHCLVKPSPTCKSWCATWRPPRPHCQKVKSSPPVTC